MLAGVRGLVLARIVSVTVAAVNGFVVAAVKDLADCPGGGWQGASVVFIAITPDGRRERNAYVGLGNCHPGGS